MKFVVIGGTGLIGSKTVAILRHGGHEVVAASPKRGINSITGEGLKDAMAGAQVVIDLANSPSFEDKAVLEFFETSGRNLHAAEAAAGVRHHVALSIVGTDRTPDNGYFRAKVVQEKLIKTSGIPYTIIRSTQFLESLRGRRHFLRTLPRGLACRLVAMRRRSMRRPFLVGQPAFGRQSVAHCLIRTVVSALPNGPSIKCSQGRCSQFPVQFGPRFGIKGVHEFNRGLSRSNLRRKCRR